ncbi:forkhead box protein J1-A-like [Heterodontus francisci]|uniref:forkhead box protein J1-A-like n=1 Tax=Heterodontus francisci TaxID=7792 RepID=UPI00355B5882
MWQCLDCKELGQSYSSPMLDDSLTNLHWLHQFAVQDTECQNPAMPHKLSSALGADPTSLTMSPIPGKPTLTVAPSAAETFEEIDYITDPCAKPLFSYTTLICLAMKASNQRKVTLSTIYSWIRNSFCYYRHAEPSWQVGRTGQQVSEAEHRTQDIDYGLLYQVNSEITIQTVIQLDFKISSISIIILL